MICVRSTCGTVCSQHRFIYKCQRKQQIEITDEKRQACYMSRTGLISFVTWWSQWDNCNLGSGAEPELHVSRITAGCPRLRLGRSDNNGQELLNPCFDQTRTNSCLTIFLFLACCWHSLLTLDDRCEWHMLDIEGSPLSPTANLPIFDFSISRPMCQLYRSVCVTEWNQFLYIFTLKSV